MHPVNDNARGDMPISELDRRRMAERLDGCIAALSTISDPDLARAFEHLYRDMKRITLESTTLEVRRERLAPLQAGVARLLSAADAGVDRGAEQRPSPTIVDVLNRLERDGRDVLARLRHQRDLMLTGR